VGSLGGVLQPSRLLTAAGAVLLVASAAWWLLREPPPPVETSLPVAASSSAVRSMADASASSTAAPHVSVSMVVVQAAGAVAQPGVYSLADGARVADLVTKAGGATPDAELDAVSLAAKLVDGQRVYVPRVGEADPSVVGASTSPAPGPTPEAPLDLNLATVEQLDQLPGVGPTTAAAIVAHRERHGPFGAVDSLLEVRGIGPVRLDELRPLVRV
jgi:competence protein ComEA